tara:strand:- start:88 stop:399 length:312 start_codon:yes stop_codon:yes gene_type:complete
MKKLPTKFILTALAFTGGILLTRYLRKKREDKNTGVETSKTTIGDPSVDYSTMELSGNELSPDQDFARPDESLNFSGNVAGTSDTILDGMDEEQANNLLEELK